MIAINWIESRAWDGRLALVVACDVAVYEEGPARPTGGCGAVVMLVGPNAPIVAERGLSGTHAEHAYDFYKPQHDKEYALVNGKLSQECYLRGLDNCYSRYKEKFEKSNYNSGTPFSMDDADYIIFHSPYNKLVQQSLARLCFNDFVANPQDPRFASAFEAHKDKTLDGSYGDREVGQDFWAIGKPVYEEKVLPSTTLSVECGNMYCGSLYAGLLSILVNKKDELLGKRLLLFSYGSGAISTLFSLRVKRSVIPAIAFSNFYERLARRKFFDPEEFSQILARNEVRYVSRDFVPTQPVEELMPGTFYLRKIDIKHQRFYKRVPTTLSKL